MATARLTYKGELRTEAVHLRSGKVILNDAPTDNHGKGEAFSPTDMLATSLGTCMITVMGIYARQNGIRLEELQAEVTKTMTSDPRRVKRIRVAIEMRGERLDKDARTRLERVARNCPVALSLAGEVEQMIEFNYT